MEFIVGILLFVFNVNQSETMIATYNSTVGVIKIGGLLITGLALFVGAIGIMNIMFVSVKERTKEIGIRKALGATRKVILLQFLSESAMICFVGGLIGFIIAGAATQIMNEFLPVTISITSFVIASIVSITTGILAGISPAYKAAKLEPVEALRYE